MTLVSNILFVREYLVLMICKSSCKITFKGGFGLLSKHGFKSLKCRIFVYALY